MLADRESNVPRQPARAAATTLTTVIALALVAAPAAAQQLEQPAVITPAERRVQQVDDVHVVEAGESLSTIAAVHGIDGDDGWRRLYDANPDVEDPDALEPGDRIRIPDADEELEPRELPAGAPAATGAPATGAVTTGGVWDRLAQCEAGGNWHIDTGNGYYGGLQFSLSSWQAVGGSGYPHQHGRATQIAMAERLLARQGWGAWPSCSRQLGLR